MVSGLEWFTNKLLAARNGESSRRQLRIVAVEISGSHSQGI
jgi:hypothetical protein